MAVWIASSAIRRPARCGIAAHKLQQPGGRRVWEAMFKITARNLEGMYVCEWVRKHELPKTIEMSLCFFFSFSFFLSFFLSFLLVLLLDLDQELFQVESWVLGIRFDCNCKRRECQRQRKWEIGQWEIGQWEIGQWEIGQWEIGQWEIGQWECSLIGTSYVPVR